MKASYVKYLLNFKEPAGTSRGILNEKETWIIQLDDNGKKGIGECGILRGLSCDDRPDYEEKLAWTCANIHLGNDQLWEAAEKASIESLQKRIKLWDGVYKQLQNKRKIEPSMT